MKKKILIIQTAFLGDVVLITPLIRETKKLFPNTQIDVLLRPEFTEILKNNPDINYVLAFDKKRNKRVAFYKTLLQIRKGHYDLAISPHSSMTTALLMLLSNIPNRLGFDRGLAGKLLTMKVPHLKNIHKIKKNLHLLSVFSNDDFDMQTELYLSEKERNIAQNIFRENHFNNRNVIAISPGSIWPTKCWPENYYTKLTQMLGNSGFSLIFLGGGTEYNLCQRIIDNSGVNASNLSGRLSILESSAVLEKCKLLICNDSAPLHLANAIKTDVFAFFGPTVKEFGYYPFRKNDFVFEVNLPCRPCGSHGGTKCPKRHHKCMKLITPDIVMKRIEERFTQDL